MNDILERIKGLSAEPEPVEPTEEVESIDVTDDEVQEVEESAEIVEESDEIESDDDVSDSEIDEESYFDIDGEEITLKQIREWQQSGLRQSDYTKKTTEVADKRKALEAREAELATLLNAYNSKISELDGLLSEQEASIDWEELAEDDPAEYLKQERKLKAKKAKLKAAQAERDKASQAKLQDETRLLLEKIPTWDKSDDERCMSYAQEIGLDLSKVDSHAVYLALYEASKFRQLESKTPQIKKKVAKAPKTIKAKKAQAKARPTEIEEAKSRLRQTGSKDDALAALKLMFRGN